MATRPGEERVQVPMAKWLGQEFKKLAVDLQDHVQRDRAMDRGPMLAYVARWFYEQSREAQISVVQTGKALADSDAPHGSLGDREGAPASEAPQARGLTPVELPSRKKAAAPRKTKGKD